MILLRWLQRGVEALLALLILFEEWGWEPLKRVMAWIARWPPLGWLERRIASLPPYLALVVFFAPTLLLIPVKLAALWLIGRGQALLGVVTIVAAKLAGTALVAWLFHLTHPALMRLAWFAAFYARWTMWKGELLARVRASPVWRASRALKQRLRQRVARWRRGA
jgi:hypothetical protein